MKNITIIGGGIIGLSCAYYLHKAGHKVSVIDNTDMKDGASYGNAGQIVPSHFVPLASPGIIAQGMRWMLNSSSPFYIKPRLDADLIRWGLSFWRKSGEKTMQANIPHLHQLLMLSRDLFEDMKNDLGNNFFMKEKGILIVYKTAESEKHEKALALRAEKMGMHTEVLSAAQVQELESATTIDVRGGVIYKEDAHLHPGLFTTALKNYLANAAVKIIDETEVKGFEASGTNIKAVITNKEKIISDEFILANGAWLPFLTKKIGINILMQAGKGYSITYKKYDPLLQYPAILVDHRVVTTPVGNDLRLSGTMEINSPGSPMMPKRVKAIVDSVKKYYPDLDLPYPEKQEAWSGLRPLSPDGLPYIGRHSKYNNLVIAGGHAMLGLSLATGTGKIVQEIIEQKQLSIPIDAFNVERFS
ncbi:MAG TPA: FAD-dependent oxidoreductase [Ferruginibacter sp.]|nr:FAD-dependent oxidoreductase [Ferruginibacter sp.]